MTSAEEATVLVRVPRALVDAVHAAKNVDAYKEYNDAPSPCNVARQYEISALMRLGEAAFAAQPVDGTAALAALEKKAIEGLLGVEAKDAATAKRAFQDHLDSFFLKGWNEALDVVESSVEADDVWPADWRAKYLDPIHMLKALVGRLRKMVWGVPWVWKGEMSDAINEERSRIIAFIKESPSP